MTAMFTRLAALALGWTLFSCQESPAPAEVEGSRLRLIRFSPDGPEGIGLRGDGPEREHVYYRKAGSEWVSAGVWEAEPYTSGPDVFGYSELMLLIRGSVTLVDAKGREETFGPGDAVLVPRGVAHHWKQEEVLRKYWVIFDEGAPDDWTDRTRAESFIRFEPRGPDGTLSGDGPEREHVYYEARGGTLSAGVWEADPSMSDELHAPGYSELMCILEGSVMIIDEAGREEQLTAGDVVLVPKGMRYRWKQPEYLRKYWVIFDAD